MYQLRKILSRRGEENQLWIFGVLLKKKESLVRRGWEQREGCPWVEERKASALLLQLADRKGIV